MNDWQRVTDPMNPPTEGYMARINGGFVGTYNQPESTMNTKNLTSAAAHAEACKVALADAYSDAVKSGNSMAAYAIELALRDAVLVMQAAYNLLNAAESDVKEDAQ